MFSWFYRIEPSANHSEFSPYKKTPSWHRLSNISNDPFYVNPTQLRWLPQDLLTDQSKHGEVDFVDGTYMVASAGDPQVKTGCAIHLYNINSSMGKRVLCNADGDLLIVPQVGTLLVFTEFGKMLVGPREICVIQRGMKFKIDIDSSSSSLACRGYIAEIFTVGHFQLPDLGPIGANGLANPQDFQIPVAWYEDKIDDHWDLLHKFQGKLFIAKMHHSPFDVVGWHGNYCPYKYNLDLFCPMNSVLYDHPDPSIFTVLTCQTGFDVGTAVMDFVIFPPRWVTGEHTFRPPYYHRNCMCEYMGLISGEYDAKHGNVDNGVGKKKPSGFLPGGASLHTVMTGHGPETEVFRKASEVDDTTKPVRYKNGNLAFMFESCYILNPTSYAVLDLNADIDIDYLKNTYNSFKRTFNASQK